MYEEITGESLADLPLIERLDRTDKAGLIYWPEKKGGTPRFKQYIDISLGQPLQDIIVDISAIPARAAERLGYPTQKPIALMERIVEASSSKGDVVLDPFCGCGTTIVAAERLDRRWVGIDVTNLAITLVKHRLIDTFGKDIEFETVGEPTSLPDAAALAAADRFQFQVWALGLIGARPDSPKKGADRGIDGVLYFHEPPAPETKQIVISVKSGKPKVTDVRDLASVVDREDAEIGVLITLQAPTGPMTREAATRGFYESAYGKHPKIQILTIEDLFDGKQIDRPPTFSADTTFSRAQKGKNNRGLIFHSLTSDVQRY